MHIVLPARIHRWVHATPAGLIGLAVLVGVGAGLGAVAFRHLVSAATWVFSGHADYSAVTGHPPHPWFPWLGAGFVVLAPVVGGLVHGPLVHRFAREARGHGVPEVMFAVQRRGGRIPGRVAAVKALASAVTIGSGGSVGREGPIVQIGAALASSFGRVLGAPEQRLRTLVACGSAGGIAATFNAPLAGVFFALELLLRDFAAEAFGAVVLSAVTASVIGRAVLGDAPFLTLPAFRIESPPEYLLYALLGLLAGAVGVAFVRVLYAVEDGCDRIWRGPEWARPAVGGVLLGLILLALPQLYGVGYPVLQDGVAGRYALGLLLVLLVGKMLATSLTIGIGGSGGVFAPSLFIGAMLGAAFADVAGTLAPFATAPVGAYALVGMGAVFAGAARAPITAVVILFELTGEYTVILPLMLAVVLATAVSRGLSRDTVYTLKLRRRGVDLDEPAGDARLAGTPVSAVMEPVPGMLRSGLSLRAAADALLHGGHPALPVLDGDRLVGVAAARDVAVALADDEDAASLTVADVAQPAPRLTEATTLHDALAALGEEPGVPVLRGEELVGWLTPRAVLRAVD